ncbi:MULTISPECIES: hypothetical protein [Actinoplanes]|uniref:hypothetical protein n=1 Tax=Actinoplanes TaxID=1865 RepID=UPI0005F29DD6|nr:MULTISPECIES: hypothetical protein [Actinoplanes]
MRGKLMFLTGLAAGFVLGSRAGREKYEEIRANAQKVWEHPTVQEAAGVAQAQANKLYTEGKDKIQSSKLGEKLNTTGTSTSSTTTDELLAPSDSLAGSSKSTTSTGVTPKSTTTTGVTPKSTSTTTTSTTGANGTTY